MTPVGGTPDPGDQRRDDRDRIETPDQAPAQASWLDKAAAVVYCIFCIEIGLFLLIYPWMPGWEKNYLVQMKPSLTGFLTSVQFRGAVSGLGILNLFAALSEIMALRRYSSR